MRTLTASIRAIDAGWVNLDFSRKVTKAYVSNGWATLLRLGGTEGTAGRLLMTETDEGEGSELLAGFVSGAIEDEEDDDDDDEFEDEAWAVLEEGESM